MICYLFPEPTYFLFSPEVPALLYYAQIPATVVALLLGFYILRNDSKSLLNRLLFTISIFFSIWTMTTLISWTNIHSNFIIFVWSFFGLILGLISILCIYFMYVFLEKRDVSTRTKISFLILLAPIIILASTSLNISGFNITNCDAFDFEWFPYKIYTTSLGVLAMIWIIVLLIRKYKTATHGFRKQITLMGAGIELFLFSFFGMEFIATYLTKIGIFSDSQLELYGLFGMVIFMIYISILMVKFHTFNVKLIATQALVWGLVLLIGSQFFFIKEQINFILNGFGFVAAIILGQLLIRSIKNEIEVRIKIEKLAGELANSNQQQENLIHFIAHQIKGFLTKSKYIFAELVDGTYGELNPEVKKLVSDGLKFNTDGVNVVQDVLHAANVKTGKVTYEKQPLNLAQIIKSAFDNKRKDAQEKNLEFVLNIKDADYQMLGDQINLEHAVRNLIDNSIKYTLSGKIEVSLEREGDKIHFIVKDTGVGLSEEDKIKLFTEGGRGKDSQKINVDSTGFGLFIVKGIIEAHGGTVRAESEGKGKGSTFTIELPVK